METIHYNENEVVDIAKRVAEVIADGGLACIPCNGVYRIIADFTDETVVMTLLQSKRKVKRAPTLVFVKDEDQANEFVEFDDAGIRVLAKKFWPGSLTILTVPRELSRKLTKQITTKSGKIGIRVPDCTFTQQVLAYTRQPLLVSSANREKKSGETSPAQVRKNFANHLAIFVDAGDLPGSVKSTVIDPDGTGGFSITREGELDETDILS